MARIAIIGLALFLGACWPNDPTKFQRLGQCRLDALRFEKIHDKENPNSSTEEGDLTELCMNARGYKIDNDSCPSNLRADSKGDISVYMYALGQQKWESTCYVSERGF